MAKYFRACKLVSIGCFLTGACWGTLCVLVIYSKLPAGTETQQIFAKPRQVSTKAGQVFTKPEVSTKARQAFTKAGQVSTKARQVFTKPGQVSTKARQVFGKPGQVSTKARQDFTKAEHVSTKLKTLPTTVLQKSKELWNVRKNIQGSFSDIMSKLKHVKTIENIPYKQQRFGVVNGNIWIRQGQNLMSGGFAVFDTELNKVTEYKWNEITGAYTAQQVSVNDVMILAYYGLHVVNTEGKYQYKIMNGHYTDISVSNKGEVAVVESQQNKLIFLQKKHYKWQIQHQIGFDGEDNKLKSLLISNDNAVFVSITWSHRILKLNKQTGEILQQYGSGTKSSQLGEFRFPLLSGVDAFGCVIVSDSFNGRFQVIHPDGEWKEIRVKGANRIRDVIVLEDIVFILSKGYGRQTKLSTFTIN